MQDDELDDLDEKLRKRISKILLTPREENNQNVITEEIQIYKLDESPQNCNYGSVEALASSSEDTSFSGVYQVFLFASTVHWIKSHIQITRVTALNKFH